MILFFNNGRIWLLMILLGHCFPLCAQPAFGKERLAQEKYLFGSQMNDSSEYHFEGEYFFQQSLGAALTFFGGFNELALEKSGLTFYYSPKRTYQFHEFVSVCAGTNLQAFYNLDEDMWGITLPLTIGVSAGHGAEEKKEYYDFFGDDPAIGGFLNTGPATSLRAYADRAGQTLENLFGFYVDGGVRFYDLEIRSTFFKPFKRRGYTFDFGIAVGWFF
jgi:hypothetical protein